MQHLRDDVARLSSKEKKTMYEAVFAEWNRPSHIVKLFKAMEKAKNQAERWGLEINEDQMVQHVALQCQDSGMFDTKFLRDWERKPENEKTWAAIKEYFLDEYQAILDFSPNKNIFESANSVNEQQQGGQDVTDVLEEYLRDARVGNEQIHQMSEAFKGASTVSKEVMERFKASQAEMKALQQQMTTLINTNKQLTENNQKLTESNKQLAEALKALGNNGGGGGGRYRGRKKAEMGKCNICNQEHEKPFVEHCWELDRNKDQRPANWQSRL